MIIVMIYCTLAIYVSLLAYSSLAPRYLVLDEELDRIGVDYDHQTLARLKRLYNTVHIRLDWAVVFYCWALLFLKLKYAKPLKRLALELHYCKDALNVVDY